MARLRRAVLIGGGLALVVGFALPESVAARIAFLFLNWVALPVLLVLPTIVLHELGHWATALALGLHVHDVQFGFGPDRWVRRWGDVRIRWKVHPIMGLVRASVPTRRLARTRTFLVTLAGPATHVVTIALGCALADWHGQLGEGFLGLGPASTGLNPLIAIVWLNAMLLLVNLAPQEIGRQPTDGALLLALPRFDASQVDALLEARWALPAERALCEGDWEGAERAIDAGLEEMPDGFALNLLKGAWFASIGSPERAVLLLRALHARDSVEPQQRALVANALAWCLVMIDDADDRPERDALLMEAERSLGEQPAILSTRGAALLADGRASEAWLLLVDALSKIDEMDPRATVLCNLARAEHRLGLPEQARRHLDEARADSPENPLLAVTTDELACAPRLENRRATQISQPPRTLELPIQEGAPARRRRRVPGWAWASAALLLLFGGCLPPYLEAMITIDVPHHDLTRGTASDEERRACADGIEHLERYAWLLSRLPEYGGDAGIDWRQTRLAHLEACAGRLEQARERLRASTDPLVARLEAHPVDDDRTTEFDRVDTFVVAFAAFEQLLSLVHLEDRLGDAERLDAALTRADRVATLLDASESTSSRHASRARLVVLRSQLAERDRGAEEALVELDQHLDSIPQEASEADLIGLLQRRATLLERLGREQEATAAWARVGRASHVPIAWTDPERG